MNAARAVSTESAAAELDELTLARARRGDEAACRALVRCYQDRVFALVGRMLGPRDLDAHVEDVAQETFLRVFRSVERFRSDGRARLSTWILTIATRLAIDLIRRQARRSARRHPGRPAREPTVDPIEPPGRALLRAIGELSVDQQAVFALRAWHELGYEEIAAVLDLELGTVKSRLSRARAQLRRTLARRTR